MGSACQKPPDDEFYQCESDEIQLDDFKIEQEQYPLRIHKGGRKVLHKSKRLQKEFESVDIYQEPLIQSDDQINQLHKSYLQKSTYSSIEKNMIAQDNQKHLMSIMKQQSSQILIHSSLKAFSTTNSKFQQSSTKIRDRQEKHVRFKLPKSHKKRTHSKYRNRLNTQVSNNL